MGSAFDDGLLLAAVSTFGGVTLTLGRFWYGTIRERINELREERDYWRNKVDPTWPPPPDE